VDGHDDALALLDHAQHAGQVLPERAHPDGRHEFHGSAVGYVDTAR